MKHATIALAATLVLGSTAAGRQAKNFGEDVQFLTSHKETIVLSSKDGKAKVAVVPAYQGRVMTSTAGGDGGGSYGWINYELVGSGKTVPKMNAFGGEDRFWMGPEGGQFAIFFGKGKKFTIDDWQTPACIDTDAYKVMARSDSSVSFEHAASLVNYSGTPLEVKIARTVRLLDAGKELKSELGGARAVAYESENTITNAGKAAWTKETGLLSIWILSMYNPSPTALVVIPFRAGPESELGPVVNDKYFGQPPADRLAIKDGYLVFRADGQHRAKIGLSPKRAKPVMGSYDSARGLLTIVTTTIPAGATDYVNSMWEVQKNPFGGDAVNSYNDGPVTPGGKPLGPFYELESSSPAAALGPGGSMTHTHRTVHIEGSREELDRIAKKALGVGLAEIEGALPKK